MKSIFESNPIFKEAAKRVRFRLEAASKLNKEIFDQPWYEKHFAMGATPHMLDSFETILGKLHLTIAASTINGHAGEPLRMNQGYASVPQKMLTHAHAYKMEADYIRQLIIMAQMAERNADKKAVDYITNVLFNAVKEAVSGVKSRLDVIVLGALSNEGKFTFSADNDPQSPFVGQEITFGTMKETATVGSSNNWLDPTTGAIVTAHQATVDPIVEIDGMLERQRVPIKKILIDRNSLRFMLGCASIKGYLNTIYRPNLPVSANALNAWMQEQGYPTFEVVERQVGIQNGNVVTPYTPYKFGKLVFLPEDQIGTIETRLSDAELGLKSEGVKYSNYGRIEVRTLTQGEAQNTEYAEIVKAAITATPAFDTIDAMMSLDVTK